MRARTREGKESPRSGALGLDRVRFYSIVVLVFFGLLVVAWGWASNGFMSGRAARPGVDFSVFWSASYLALQGAAQDAYVFKSLAPVMAAFGSQGSGGDFFMPWLYPPTFLLAVLPLALLPFPVSYFLFSAGTTYLYVTSLLRLLGSATSWRSGNWLPIVAFPGVLLTLLLGQNSMLTASLAALSMCWLQRRPVLAGICIGLLCIKPQLGLLFPIALIAAQAWKALAAAVVTALALLGASVVAFGWETIPAFLGAAELARVQLIEHSPQGWLISPTAFAAVRLSGGSIAQAYLAQGLVALFSICGLLYVWLRQTPAGLRVAILATATMLTTPYLHGYELTWMGLAIVGMVSDCLRRGWLRGEQQLLVVVWFLPLYELLNPFMKLPQIGPVILVLVAGAILRRVGIQVAGSVTCA
ncbi:hypothetical protein OR16_24290 [Cupriavidus basilensis OR16]|uniref:DUF2029 domain-containing protein n=1 Tax=Cupriavidus basilensis OR16 TaxID=1127483 RepID=H1S9V7_9BURK|nr:glycosyltransferase family 87 protein [Cupriavidus basilensis]EHP40642.1 hypothetical protein OR16_24290 [Cupriavidus basilensis OR16]